ncbi:hypothetical protein ACFWBH_15175 [Streptomyces sp. NPDC059999]|uniref:hypothetical protein n=1 Tax=Streptomyces sp. NPDC059999 TaxID=3347030 RepID=UPI0036744EBB
MTEHHPAEPDDDHEADVLGSYLEVLRARLDGERFEALIAAVRTTCALLEDDRRTAWDVPAGRHLPPDLQREYLSLMAVMITGHLDHRLVELAAPDGARGWAVVDNTRPDTERAWIDTELDGIVRATDFPTP